VSPALESPNTPTTSPTTATPPETSPPETSPPISSPDTSTSAPPDEEESPPTPEIALTQFVLEPDTIPAGKTAQGILKLNDLAIANTVITLSSDRPDLVTVPPEVVVPTGETQAIFEITTQSPENVNSSFPEKISSQQTLAQVMIPSAKVNIQATHGDVTLTQVLTIELAVLPSPSISPNFPQILRSPFQYPILRSPISRE
jgi:hypothetical protein